MKKEIIIIGGANGSGKTTFAKSYGELYRLDFVNADEIAKHVKPKGNEGILLTAGKQFFQQIYQLMDEEKSFMIESTLSGKSLAKLIQKMKDNGYTVKIIYIFLENPDTCIERIKERVQKGGHHVPPQDVVRRFYRSKQNFWDIYKELADNWFLVFNSDQKFTEFAYSSGESYLINDRELFDEFMQDIKENNNGSG